MRILIASTLGLLLASCNVASVSDRGEGVAIEYGYSRGLTNVNAHPLLINDSNKVCSVSSAGVIISSDQGPAVVCFDQAQRPYIPQTFKEPS
jgi:hypothetical protein